MADTQKIVTLPRASRIKQRAENPLSTIPKDSNAPKDDRLSQVSATTIRNLRANGSITTAIRALARQDGVVSSAIYNMIQVANSGFTIKAYNSSDHSFSREGSLMAKSILTSMDRVYDYSKGYSDRTTTQAGVETALKEVCITSGICAELVLNKARLPDKINLIPYDSIQWKSTGDGNKYPVQIGQTGEIPLDFPNFWVAELHKDATSAYSKPIMEAGLDAAFHFGEFVEDMRRSVRRAGHSRLIVKLDYEKVLEAAPDEIRKDAAKSLSWLEKTRADVEGVISALEPEDALVVYDNIDADTLDAEGEKADYKDLLNAISGLLATSLKTHPSILGLRLAGSQSLSNTESLIYLKGAKGLQGPVETLYSKAMTLAVRLYGLDVYVDFSFKEINLRPEDELEAFKTMKQSRILELLSIGLLSDDQATAMLGLELRPAGATNLSGTFFKTMKTNADKASPNADPMGNALQPDTPSNAGGESQ